MIMTFHGQSKIGFKGFRNEGFSTYLGEGEHWDVVFHWIVILSFNCPCVYPTYREPHPSLSIKSKLNFCIMTFKRKIYIYIYPSEY